MQAYEILNKNSTSLEVSPYFLNYSGEDSDYYYFFVVFNMLQSNIVKNSLLKVTVNVYNNSVSNNDEGIKGYINSSKINLLKKSGKNTIQKILNKNSIQVDIAKEKIGNLISSTTVGNLESSVFYDAITELKSGKNPKDISALYRSKFVLEELTSSEIRDLLFTNCNVSNEEIRNLNMELISKQLMDPAVVVSKNYQTLIKNQLVEKIRDFYLSQRPSSSSNEVLYKTVQKVSFLDKISFSSNLKIPKEFATGDVSVVFEVYKQNYNVPIDVRTKKIEVLKHIKLQQVINDSAQIDFASNHLTCVQNDKKANAIQVFKKEINNIGHCTDYTLFKDSKLLQGKKEVFSAKKQSNLLQVYRCFSLEYPTTVKNPFFKSVVVGDAFQIDQTGLIITDKLSSSAALQLKIVNQPSFASQFKIIRKQVVANSIREDTKIEICKYQDFTGLSTIADDETVKSENVYEYSVFYKTRTGEEKRSVSQIYRYINSSISTAVSTVITGKNIDTFNGKPRIAFNISSVIKEKESDKIKSHLRNVDIYEEFQTEMGKINDKFNDLIIHRVVRVNLNNGLREIFEDIPAGGGFSDDYQTRQKFSISEIDTSSSYLYEVRISLRDPTTLLRDYVKTATVQLGAGTKTYSYRPYRWRQPTTLSTGTILAQDEDGNIISNKNLFEDGEIGVTATTVVASLEKLINVKNLVVERVELQKIKVTWEVEGLDSDYDHFVVTKSINGKRSFLGAISTTEFIDQFNYTSNAGSIAYYITPVLKNYVVGTVSKTQTVVIDPQEFTHLQLIE